MEQANLAIVNTRDRIINTIKDSKLPAMVVKMILAELVIILEKEADIAISREYEEYMSNIATEEEESKE